MSRSRRDFLCSHALSRNEVRRGGGGRIGGGRIGGDREREQLHLSTAVSVSADPRFFCRGCDRVTCAVGTSAIDSTAKGDQN